MTKDGGDEEGSEEEEQELKLEDRRYGKRDGKQEDEDPEQEKEEEQDDDEANADLSLQIVEKAGRRHRRSSADWEVRHDETPANVSPVAKEDEDFMEGHSSSSVEYVAEKAPKVSRSETPEEGELQEDEEGNLVLAAELHHYPEVAEKNRKMGKKDKKRKRRGDDIDHSIDNLDKTLVREVKDGEEAEENMAMRKLLRGPRYFDPPEEQGHSCFNCGKVGHLAAACPEGPRLKPCYVCGGFGHDGRDCPQKVECYVCAKVGHIAKNCPNKGMMRGPTGVESVCLLCGHPGHEASACYHSYDPQDLAKVQCYVCNNFGHMCCVIVVDTSPLPVSCFNCGEMGHTGRDCARTRRNDRDGKERSPASVCFKCGEVGHYARGCSKKHRASWPPPWPADGHGLASPRLPSPRREPDRDVQLPNWTSPQNRESRWTPWRINTQDRWTGSRGVLESRNADDDDGPPGVDVNTYRSRWTFEDLDEGYHKRRRRVEL